MNSAQKICIALLACATVQAQASVITLSTAKSTAGAQANAQGYRTEVEKALLTQTQGYGSTTLASYDSVSNQSLFGANSNIAWKATIDFGVGGTGPLSFAVRTGVDFGYGGALFLDGVALTFSNKDLYTAGNYANTSQVLQYAGTIGAGNHTLTIYGLENCCDGVQQAQFKLGNSTQFTSFSSTDGLNPAKAVPEPATLASFALGLGLMVALRRKQRG